VINDARRRQRRRRCALVGIAILVAALIVAVFRGWQPDKGLVAGQGSGRERTAATTPPQSPPFRAWRYVICSGGHLVFLDSPPSPALLRLYPIQRDVAGIRVSHESGKPVGVCLS
jgi:hypothetical protein